MGRESGRSVDNEERRDGDEGEEGGDDGLRKRGPGQQDFDRRVK